MRTFAINSGGEAMLKRGGKWEPVGHDDMCAEELALTREWDDARKAIKDKVHFRVYGMRNNKKRLGEISLETEVVCSKEPGIPLRGKIVAERRRAVKQIVADMNDGCLPTFQEEMSVGGRIHALAIHVVVTGPKDVVAAERALSDCLSREDLMDEVMAVY